RRPCDSFLTGCCSAIRVKRHARTPRTGGFWGAQIQIDNNRILSVSHNYGLADLVRAGVDFLVRYVRWNVNKIARLGFLAEFQFITPAHSNSALDDVEDRLQFSMVMRPGLGIRLNQHRTGPQFVCSSSGVGDGGGARHAWCLWRIQIEFARTNNFHSMFCPIHFIRLVLVRLSEFTKLSYLLEATFRVGTAAASSLRTMGATRVPRIS